MIGSTSTPATSPSSDGVASATIASSLSPQDLTDEYEAVDTAAELSPRSTLPSTPSVFSKNAFAANTNDAAEEGNNGSLNNQAQPVNRNLLESIMGLRGVEGKGAKFSLYRMMVGSMLAYVVLCIWIWTVVQFIIIISDNECHSAYSDLGSTLQSNPQSDLNFGNATATMSCLEEFTGSLACAHSITFGLISAVVIHETGSADETAKDRLSNMINPVMKRRDVNANCIQRTFCSLITSLPTVYIIGWTVFGLVCFVYSLVLPDGSTGPLFYTGQTWIGLVVKATYSFFGIEEPDDVETSQTHLSQQQRGQGRV